jgi:two-component system, OmpR family, sensor histidine kinase KdpD
MSAAPPERSPTADAVRRGAAVVLLLAVATGVAYGLDTEVSLTSQAMIYLLAVVVAAYRLHWLESLLCALGAVTAFNFFFVPPRFTLAVEHHEHFIALAAMLGVALLISHLTSSLRRESAIARRSEARARHLQSVAIDVADAADESQVLAIGQRALDTAFEGPCVLVLADERGELRGASDLPAPHRDGLRSCMREAAVLGPGTSRWPGLAAWYLPLGDKAQMVGAASVEPAVAADADSREHAEALCALLAQAAWRLRLSAAMRATQAEVERQQLQGTLLAAVSHDLRTPLAAIVGAASSLRAQGDRLACAEQDRLLVSIEDEANYLATLSENTLQLVRLSTGPLALRRDWESIEEVVGAVLGRVRGRDPSRRITSRVPAGLPLVKADPVLLSQLLCNLLDNALKYSDGPVHLVAAADEAQLCIAVKDRGPGIAADEEARVFEPFMRGDHRHHEGAGLGLAVCRAIALAHGGQLTFRRRRAGGSSFCLGLPLEADQPAGDVR